MVHLVKRAAYVSSLAALGFVLATFGLSTYAGETLMRLYATSEPERTQPDTRVATACIPDVAEQDEIFFLSCGGLF